LGANCASAEAEGCAPNDGTLASTTAANKIDIDPRLI
jgi:hypothetical protein